MSDGRPVLVTGSNRSGTTWVGRVLCESGELGYLHEPFNPTQWPRLLATRLGGHYAYVPEGSSPPFEGEMASLLRYRFPLLAQVPEVRTPLDVARLARSEARMAALRARGRRPLLKDPIALFAAGWLAERFDVDVVVLVRRPVAFASSIKRLRWSFDFSWWLQQEDLLRDHLGPFRAEIEEYAAVEHDHVDQAILLWRCMYAVVDDYRRTHPSWHYLRYEDLASNPVEGFHALYASLGLRYDDAIGARIASYSDEGNVKEVPARDPGTVRRDSRAALETWQTRLTPDEVARVRDRTADVASRFYPADV